MRKVVLCLLLSAILLTETGAVFAQKDNANNMTPDAGSSAVQQADEISYAAYSEAASSVPAASGELVLDASQAVSKNATISDEQAVLRPGDSIRFEISTKTEAVYQMELTYQPLEEGSGPLSISVSVNGAVPFREAAIIELPRIWAYDAKIMYDANGNQRQPIQREVLESTKTALYDPLGRHFEPLSFVVPKEGSIEITALDQPVVIRQLRLYHSGTIQNYSEYSAENNLPNHSADVVIPLEAEQIHRKNDKMMMPLNNSSSSKITPFAYNEIRYNTIGGTKWQYPGQYITWKVNVDKAGYYRIGTWYLQNEKMNAQVIRRLYIDGELPFSEANTIPFDYSRDWERKILGEDDTESGYRFYLDKGEHTITLMVNISDLGDILTAIENVLSTLGDTYLDIVSITSAKPDTFRSYELRKIMPHIFVTMDEAVDELKSIENDWMKATGAKNGQMLAMIRRLYGLLTRFCDNEVHIYKSLSDFESQLASLYSSVENERYQPLELDKLFLLGDHAVISSPKESFFASVKRQVLQFIGSFYYDYSALGVLPGEKVRDQIVVWSALGREQNTIIKQLIDNKFSSESHISVRLQNVSGDALMSAIVAQIAPDVHLSMSQAEIMNFAFRNAIEELSSYKGIEEVTARFKESAMVPLSFGEKIYGIPETQNFPVLFYRRDVLEKIDISLSQLNTWDDVIHYVMPKLQKSSLGFGIPFAFNNYLMFLYQREQNVYRDNGRAVNLDTQEAFEALTEYARFYKEYGFDISYDFANRFRKGEMPIAIADYSAHNQLSVFAPEIKDLWGMTTVPGTMTNGTIRRDVPTMVTGTAILRGSKKKDAAWEFLEWWSRADTVSDFASGLESVLGTAARYAAANVEAVEQIPWNLEMRKGLAAQWEWTKALPEVPGGYYLSRYLSFALNDVVIRKRDPAETLVGFSREIDAELKYMRKELGIDP